MVVSTILLAVLLLVIVLAIRDNSNTRLRATVAETSTPVSTSAATRTVTATAVPPTAPFVPVSLDQPRRVEAGGFTFRPLQGYTLDITDTAITMTATSETPAAGSSLALSGGTPAKFVSTTVSSLARIFELYVSAYAAQANLQPKNSRSITVDGAAGLAADLTGSKNGQDLAGAIAIAQPDANRLFVMVGYGPAAAWRQAGQPGFESVLESVKLFEPTVEPTATPASIAAVTTATTEPLPTGLTVYISPTTATPSITPRITESATPTVTAPAPRVGTWHLYTNGNFANAVALMKSTIWTATSGGVVAWNKTSGSSVKFTTLDGLSTNYTVAATSCPLPGLGVLFGTNQGLQVFDTQNGSWKTLNSANSPMSFDDIAVLHCDVENGYLVVGYARHGIDIFDAKSGAWKHLDEKDGLSFDTIHGIAVVGDRQAIWVASGLGLSIIENNKTLIYNADNSPLDSNDIDVIASDGVATVWLATATSLYQTNGTEWKSYNKDTVKGSDFPAGRITGLAIAPDGKIWIGSDQTQICQFDPKSERCVAFFAGAKGMAAAPLTSLAIGSDSEIYYTSAGDGVSLYDGKSWRQFVIADEPLPGNAVHQIAEDAEGSIWLATNAGAARLSGTDGSTVQIFTPANSPLPEPDIHVVHADGARSTWFGSDGAATYYDGSKWTNYTVTDGLAGPLVQAITPDDQNRTWIGTRTGLSIWTGSAFFNLTTENGLPSNDITALAADGKIVWIGTRAGGLLRFQDNQLQVFNSSNIDLPSNSITALSLTSDGSLLIGTDKGMARFDKNKITPLDDVPKTFIKAIAAGPQGEIWAATGDGSDLLHFDGHAWQPFAETGKLPAAHITTLLVDQSGALWIGCEQGGAARYTP